MSFYDSAWFRSQSSQKRKVYISQVEKKKSFLFSCLLKSGVHIVQA